MVYFCVTKTKINKKNLCFTISVAFINGFGPPFYRKDSSSLFTYILLTDMFSRTYNTWTGIVGAQ